MDLEADAIIRALFVRNPDAAYRITVLAMQLQEMLKNYQTNADHRLAATASPKLFGGLLRRWQAARGMTPQVLARKIG